MTSPTTVELHAYRAEPTPPHRTRARARRLLTHGGNLLAGPIAAVPQSDARAPVRHIAVTGYGLAHGAVMAACDGGRPLAADSSLVRAATVAAPARCTRLACAALWPAAVPHT
ncbi:hypothetical protein [Kitasatospora sp. MBT63]|uniref:hypothetical protein n=1 Tax=Kitasatospora sp. MBT63 TaxID=1444768 RepID=UPI00053B2967|nr:hypothetical protein [Kitasatospora sp. MBT63]